MTDTEKIESEISNFPEGWIILLETTAEKVLEVSLSMLRSLTRKDYSGVILSASRPYSNIVSLYEKNKIDTSKMFFLDCVSKGQSNEQGGVNVLFVESAADLTNLSISINDSIKMTRGKKFMFIDSINTMLIYNKPDVFARFIHNILTKMRISLTNGLLISLENETEKEIRAEIAQLCDRVIKV